MRYLLFLSCTLILVGCKKPNVKDEIKLDGSSTVFVLSEAVAEKYKKINQDAKISIKVSGTGGGFKKLCEGSINIVGASRQISAGEQNICQQNGVQVVEIPVAYDGIVIAVNKQNNFIDKISVTDLAYIFSPDQENKILTWQYLNKLAPKEKINLFIPGVSSGTFDYFTSSILGQKGKCRGDVISSEDDNVLVHGIANDKYALGFFSFAYYKEHKDKLKALAIFDDKNSNNTAVYPSEKTIEEGSYSPLSRKIFLYVNSQKIYEKEKAFVNFFWEQSTSMASNVGFVALNKDDNERSLKIISKALGN